MSKATSLAKNTIILAIGKLFSQMTGFFLLPLYTYYMSPAEYGFVDLVIVYINLLVPTLTAQMGMVSFRYLVDARKNEIERVRVVSNILFVTVPIAMFWLLLFAVYGVFTGFEYVWMILLTGVSLLCSNLTQQMTRGLGNNKQFTIASIIIGLATLLGAVVFIVWMGLRVDGLLLSIALANIAASIYLVVIMKLYKYINLGKIDKSLQKEMFGYSMPLIPNGIAWWVMSASDRTIISLMINTAATGVYAVSTRYASMLGGLFGVFSMSWTEAASVHIDSPDRDRFFSQVANVAVRLFGALGVVLIAIMPFLFPIMIGEGFAEAYMYIPILVMGVFLNSIVGIYSAVYVAKKID